MADLLAHHEAASPAVDDETLLPSAFSTAVAWGSRYVALLAACLATGGSLFFSEALGWLPCTLCWYQRILMYPLSVLLAVGLLRRDAGLPLLVLPLSISGAGVSLYHYLLIKTNWFPPPPCRAGVPCTVDYIDIFGFINIPFLALTAFLIITLMMVVAWLAPTSTSSTAASGWRALLAPAALPMYGIIAAAVGAYSLAAYLL
jgi:disulfide bond formation protein DsbB